MTTDTTEPVNCSAHSMLDLLKKQRSHRIVVLSDATPGHESEFLSWYRGTYRKWVAALPEVLTVSLYERHEVDITQGRYPPLPFRYLGMHDISVDGAPAAEEIIGCITELHREQRDAQPPATWLYYPLSEKVGRGAIRSPCMLTLAFANSITGQEDEFREWYVTRHIRHALNVPALVSGQCFERTQFQRPGALEARFGMMAAYEQEGSPESIIDSFRVIPEATLRFPSIDSDASRFAEWVYRPV